MPFLNNVDEATIRQTIQQLTTADAECDAAQRSVTNTTSYLMANWSGEAAGQFADSIAGWQAGLSNVILGLRQLNGAMNDHYQNTHVVEQDNTNLATWT